MDIPKYETLDKCNICGWEGPSEDVPQREDGKYVCPICGSEDMDDIKSNPYEDDDDELEW